MTPKNRLEMTEHHPDTTPTPAPRSVNGSTPSTEPASTASGSGDAATRTSGVEGSGTEGGVEGRRDSMRPILAVVEPILVSHGIDLDDLAWVTERSGRTLRLTIERRTRDGKPQDPMSGFGVSLDDCADVSRDVSNALDVAEVIPHGYSLEVSSPGLDRPLRTSDDFARFVGWLCKVKLKAPASDGQRVLRGRIVSVAGSGPTAEISLEADKKAVVTRFASIESSQLVFEMQTHAKPKKSKAKKADHKKKRSG